MKRYFPFILFIVLSSISVAYADTSTSAGFIPGQIWYSQEPLVEGDTVKIYTALWNGDINPLSAHVEFYDNKVLLGARDITVSASSLEDISISWKVTAGDHSISAKISSSTITTNGKKQSIIIDNNTTTEDKTFVQAKLPKTNIIKDGITKASQTVKDISLPAPIVDTASNIDSFRNNTYVNIIDTKNQTQKQIDTLNGIAKVPVTTVKDKNGKVAPVKVSQAQPKPLDGTEKPIAYIKLFLFTVLGFIFGNKIVFYGLIVIIFFLILRFIYRKIRHK